MSQAVLYDHEEQKYVCESHGVPKLSLHCPMEQQTQPIKNGTHLFSLPIPNKTGLPLVFPPSLNGTTGHRVAEVKSLLIFFFFFFFFATEPQDWKRSVFILISKKGTARECSNYSTIALTCCKVLLKILQARLQQ